jgi:general secretion pathway protein B
MSYILDALKKSEKERQQHQSPTVHSIHSASRISQDNARSSWQIVLFFSLIVGFCGFGFWWQSANQRPSFNDVLSVVFPSKANTVQADLKQPDLIKPVSSPKATPPKATKKIASTDPQTEYTTMNSAVNTNAGEPLPIIPVLDLPDELHNSLPTMTYSFHIYSTDKNKRTIIINNHRYREGEMVGASWMLESITETGIVLRKDRDRTSIDVVDSWK